MTENEQKLIDLRNRLREKNRKIGELLACDKFDSYDKDAVRCLLSAAMEDLYRN